MISLAWNIVQHFKHYTTGITFPRKNICYVGNLLELEQ